jgi:phosphate transport system protein
MRVVFAAELAAVEKRISDELRQVVMTLGVLADAVRTPGCEWAGEIAQRAHQLRRASHEVDDELVTMTARQGPVAGDLRLVVSLLQVTQHESLIANQFELISEQLGRIDAVGPNHREAADQLAQMARLAGEQLLRAFRAFLARDVKMARQIDRDDDVIDGLNRTVFEGARTLEGGPEERELALRQMLIARSLERIGDNAVDIAEQVVFLVSGARLEFSDASQPKRRG